MMTTLRATGAQVVADGRRPLPADQVVPDCLSAHLTDAPACTMPKQYPYYNPAGVPQEEPVAVHRGGLRQHGALVLHLDHVRVIVDNLLVYRDDNHITATYASWLTTRHRGRPGGGEDARPLRHPAASIHGERRSGVLLLGAALVRRFPGSENHDVIQSVSDDRRGGRRHGRREAGLSFGVVVPAFGPLASRGAFNDAVDTIEGLGFDDVWFGDHVAVPFVRGAPDAARVVGAPERVHAGARPDLTAARRHRRVGVAV